MSTWQTSLVVMAMIAASVSGGAFFAFSNFVMPALGRLPAPTAIRSMQEINISAPSVTFVAAIVGAGPIAAPALLAEWGSLAERSSVLLAGGIVLSLASFVITMTFNVPRNNRLDAVDATNEAGAAVWDDYLLTWTRANTARTLASLASIACYAVSLG